MNNARILPTAEPFFFPGNKVGCLLIHGFTGTPKEMSLLGEALAQRGYTVLGIRLAGHATTPEDMLRTRWQDWVASCEDGYALLKKSCEQIFIIGLSMGGSLALYLASYKPATGVVAMAAPQHLKPDFRLPFLPILHWVWPYLKKGPPQWVDMEAVRDHVSYQREPVRSIIEINILLKEMRSALPLVTAPTLLVNAALDPTVEPEQQHAQLIFAAISSRDKEMISIPNSGHVITRDAGRQQVFSVVGDFVQRIVAQAQSQT